MKSRLLIISGPGSTFPTLMLAALLAAPWQSTSAAPVTSKQAAAAVTGWLSLDRKPLGETLGTSVQHVDTFSDEAGNPVYYVAYLDPAGFVIVAADDLVEPIIGFAAAGRFDPSDRNPLGALVSKDLAGRIAYAQKAGSAPPDTNAVRAQAKWQQLCPKDGGPVTPTKGLTSISDVRIAPLTQTTWNQQKASDNATACYNYYTPPYGDGNPNNYPAGCVATAMAQFIRYHQFPATGVGSAGFEISYDGYPLTYYLHGGNGPGGAYVWSNMPLLPPGTPTTVQCQAIGALVADVGATVNMAYASDGSSASLLDAKDALVSTFQYSSAIKGWNYNNDIGTGLVGMINPNLDARYPVLLGIEGTGGHAVVADGYGYSSSTLYHHLNLGWGGLQTAWYALPYVDASPYTFTVVDGCVYNIYTNGTGEIISGRVLDQIGRPVVNATVTATRSEGGTYTATTDTNGIYALARIPSSSSYSITVAKANYTSVNGNFSTGSSADMSANSGNYWGADFSMPMLTTVVDHLVWGNLASTQSLNTAFGATITAQNLTNGVATGFTGPVALSAFASGAGSATTIIGILSHNGWYYGAEMTIGYAFTPSTNIQVTAVRGYSTDSVSIWTDTGTRLMSQAVSASGSWVEAAVAAPVRLSAGTTYRVTAHVPITLNGYYRTTSWPTTFANGTVGQAFYLGYGDTFPTTTEPAGRHPLVDLRYQVVFSNSIPVSPTSSGAFVSGVWSGNVTVGQIATNVVLKADDGAGHTALSSPFNVVDPSAAPPVITTQPQSRTNNAGDNATFTLVASSGTTPSYAWRRNGSPIGGATGSSYTLNNVQLPDSGSLFSCVVSNNHGAVTSQPAVLTVVCTNVVVAAQPAVTLNADAAVYAVAPLSDGSVIFGGYFSTVNGVARSSLARLLPNGTLDMTWNPAPNGSVYTLAVSGTDLFVGGNFTSIGTFERSYIAKLSTTGTGAVDATWNPSADYRVDALVVDGGFVYAAGYFEFIGGQYRNCIAKLSASGTGAADATWNPNATMSGDYPEVMALAISGTDVFAGGYFTGIGGQTRWGIAKLSSTGAGTADSTWDPSADSTVFAVAVHSNNVYAGGGFTSIGGQSRNYIAKLSRTGTGAADATWNPSIGYADTNAVMSLAVRGLSIHAGGCFTSIGSLQRTNLAKLSTLGTGAADAAWVADCNADVWSLTSSPGALYIGGEFTQVAGQPRPGIAALTFPPLQLLSPQRPSGQFQCTLSGERGQNVEILASSNLVNWDPLVTLINASGTTNFVDPTAGLSRRFYRARQLP